MEIEEGQPQVIEQLVSQTATLETSSSLANLIVQTTSHPSLFAFSEILSLPNLLQLQGTEDSAYLDLLRLFAYGTWRDYKSNSGILPALVPDQALKLKQLTVLSLAETNKVLSYDKLQEELEVSNVRELEDFLINECMYAGIVKAKLNQLGRCFEGSHARAAWKYDRHLRRLATSVNLLPLIEEKIEWASKMYQLNLNHQQELQGRIEEAKKTIPFKKPQYKQGHHMWPYDDGFDEFDGMMEQENDLIRPKRRRSPNNQRPRRTVHF